MQQLSVVDNPIWASLGLEEHCHTEFKFKVGDQVTFTNDYEVEFQVEICGFTSGELFAEYGWCVHFCGIGGKTSGYAHWHANHPSRFSEPT